MRPPVPAALIETADDRRMSLLRAEGFGALPPGSAHRYFTSPTVDVLRAALREPQRVWSATRRARAAEIVAAWEAYEPAERAACAAAGLPTSRHAGPTYLMTCGPRRQLPWPRQLSRSPT